MNNRFNFFAGAFLFVVCTYYLAMSRYYKPNKYKVLYIILYLFVEMFH